MGNQPRSLKKRLISFFSDKYRIKRTNELNILILYMVLIDLFFVFEFYEKDR